MRAVRVGVVLISIVLLTGCEGFKEYTVRNAEALYGVPALGSTPVQTAYAPASAEPPLPSMVSAPSSGSATGVASAPSSADVPMCITADGSSVPC